MSSPLDRDFGPDEPSPYAPKWVRDAADARRGGECLQSFLPHTMARRCGLDSTAVWRSSGNSRSDAALPAAGRFRRGLCRKARGHENDNG